MSTASQRKEMVERQIRARGIRDERVLEAMARVPREAFVQKSMTEFAYEDTPLPIEEAQTISQPFVVAHMTEALEPEPGDRVLEIGTGSGYAAAVLGEVADEVYTIERHRSLAETAGRRLRELGYGNVHVRCGDGTKGWPEHAPYDGIVVAAGGPDVPRSLREQLAVGGCLVIPVGPATHLQQLLRIRRTGEDEFEEEDLGAVRFVPLIGEEGWPDDDADARGARRANPGPAAPARVPGPEGPAEVVAAAAEPFEGIGDAVLRPLLDRVGDARVVLLGEASHGTAEFYDMRARITRELIQRKGVTIVAVEADWPDARQVDRYVRGLDPHPHPERAFTRFPTWMWANRQVLAFVRWLRGHNDGLGGDARPTGFYGLDLYSLFTSIRAVLAYLEDIDPDAARLARIRYGCLSPWEGDPAAYGAAALRGGFETCAGKVVEMLEDLLRKRLHYETRDGARFFDAERNARLVANAERYYRAMYYGSRISWNLRDAHMFDTLEALLEEGGADARAVVWAHNSHLGNAAATEMSARGETNLGELCRERFGEACYAVGFGTDHGTVAAAHEWDDPMEVMDVRPAHPDSYERVCHDSGVPAFLLPLARGGHPEAREALMPERLERFIGVIYRPHTELASHYSHACLPRQFDEWIWFDESRAVDPLAVPAADGRVADTFPFGL